MEEERGGSVIGSLERAEEEEGLMGGLEERWERRRVADGSV